MIMRRAFTVLLLTAAVAGCGRDVVRTRWAPGSTPLRGDVTPALSISSVAAEQVNATRWRDLPERTGAAFAEVLGQKIPDPRQYIAALAEPIKGRAELNRNRTTLSRVIDVGVSPQGYDPVDRLVRTQVVIVPVNFQFTGYTFAQTDYQIIDLESVTSTRSQTASLKLSPQFGNTIEAAEAGVSSTQGQQSVYANRVRVRELSVGFSPRRVTITRDTAPGINLWGNTLLKASARPWSDRDIRNETLVAGFKLADENTGADLAPAKATITLSLDTLWKPKTLFVCAQLYYVSRHVTSGMEYHDEGRQVVRESEGTTPARIYELVDAEEVETQRFGLSHPSGSFVAIDTPTGIRPLTFTSALDATVAREWLERVRAGQIGARRLWVIDPRRGTNVPLRGRDTDQLEVERLRTGDGAGDVHENQSCDIATGAPRFASPTEAPQAPAQSP